MKHPILLLPTLLVSLLFMTQVSLASSWTSPPTNPPNGNAEAPINVSFGPQTKFGGLTVGSALGGGLLKAASKFFVGATPSAALGSTADYLAEVQGNIGAAKICGLNGVGCIALPLNLSATGGGSSKWATSTVNVNDIYNINLNGKVGIGTLPSVNGAKLSIKDPNWPILSFDRTGDANVTGIYNIGPSYTGGLDHLRLRRNTTDLLVIRQDGNVGIGTVSPSRQVSINTNSATNPYVYNSYNVSDVEKYVTGYEGGALDRFIIFNKTAGDYTIVAKGGKVGLSNVNPTEKLTISGRLAFTQNAGDEQNAGKLDYRGFDNSALNIVGAGTAVGNRQVRIFDKLLSPNYCDENGNNCKSITEMGATSGTAGSLSCVTPGPTTWTNTSGVDVYRGLDAVCPSGYLAVGGGADGYKYGPDSHPSYETGWHVEGTVEPGDTASLYVRCCRVE